MVEFYKQKGENVVLMRETRFRKVYVEKPQKAPLFPLLNTYLLYLEMLWDETA